MYGQYEIPSAEEIVNFGIGQPATTFLPLDKIKKGLTNILNINDPTLLQYGDIQGYPKFRKDFSNFLSNKYNTLVNPKDLLMTNGVTGGLSLICSIFTNKSTIVFVEEPTYFLAINIFKKDFNLEVVPISIENDGININQLEEELVKDKYKDKNFVLYTIPTFHNPTSYTMSEEKRIKLGKISYEKNLLVIADEVYQFLYFKDDDKPPLPLFYYGSNIISLGSFSKILAPSLRLGWIHTSENIMNKIVNCAQLDSSGGINPFICGIVHEIINNGDLDSNILFLRNELEKRCNAICSKLCTNQQTNNFIKPKGGYFVWLDLNDIDSTKMINHANNFKLKYHSGNKFSSNNSMKNFTRLSFSCYSVEGLELGVSRLQSLVKYYTEFNNKINVSIIGYNGKLGSKILKEIENNNNFIIHQKIDKNINFTPSNKNNIIIDVSSPKGTEDLINYLNNHNYKIPLLIGTTGDLPLSLINEYSKNVQVALISNFSGGIPLIHKFAKQIDENLWDLYMIEKHHFNKKDAPSGTAISISNNFNKNIEIESIREGDIFGEHSLFLENENEFIELKHIAKNRDIFAKGSIKYIQWLLKKKSGLYRSYDEVENRNIKFMKYHGTGNDFIIVKKDILNKVKNINNFVRHVCNREKGIGADGLIIFKESINHNFEWNYYNSDGSNAELCGNGARAISKYYYDLTNESKCSFINNYNISANAEIINNNNICVTLPFIIKNIEINRSMEYLNKIFNEYNHNMYKINFLEAYKVGVPHIVLSVNNLDNININKVSKYIVSNYTEFKNYNLNYTEYKNNELFIRTFERGVNRETLSCGTGCISAGYYYINNLNNYNLNEINLRVKSGDQLKIIYNDTNIKLIGNSEKVFEGEINEYVN